MEVVIAKNIWAVQFGENCYISTYPNCWKPSVAVSQIIPWIVIRFFIIYMLEMRRTFHLVMMVMIGLSFPSISESANLYSPTFGSPLEDPSNWYPQEISKDRMTVSVEVVEDDSIWLGFEEGYISHYDGSHSIDYRIYDGENHPRTYTIFVSSTSRDVFAVTDSGVFKKKGDQWSLMESPLPDILSTEPIVELSDGSIWLCHQQGLSRIEDDRIVRVFETSKAIISLCQISENLVWILADDGEALYEAEFTGHQISDQKHWKLIERFPPVPHCGAVLMKDSKGRVWLINATLNCGVVQFDPVSRSKTVYDLTKLGGDHHNLDIAEAPDGAIWVTGRNFLHRYQHSNWEVYEQSDGIPSSFRMEIDFDSEGFLYLVEGGNALYRIDEGGRYFQKLHGLQFQDANESFAWYISFTGTIVRENKQTRRWLEYGVEEGVIDTALRVKVTSDGDVVCIGSHLGKAAISVFSNEKWTRYTYPEYALTFARDSFCELEEGGFLLGCANPDVAPPDGLSFGIMHFEKTEKGFSGKLFRPGEVPENAINILQTVEGDIWTNFFGASMLVDGESFRTLYPPDWNFNWVDQINTTEDGSLWLSLWGIGVYRFYEGAWILQNEDLGLPTKSTNRLVRLIDDGLVVSTDQGLFRYDGVNWNPFLGPHLKTHRDAGNIISSNRDLWINRASSAWFDRWNKAFTYDQEKEAAFFALRYSMDSLGPQTKFLDGVSQIVEDNNATIRWEGHDAWSKTPEERLQYSVKIDDGRWSDFTYQNHVAFTDLSHGKHVIQVRSRDEDLNVEIEPKVFELVVSLPFWMHAWFRILCGLVVLGVATLVFLIIRLKVRHIEELDELRNHFFLNLSHELRTPISLITIPIERIRRMNLGNHLDKDLSMMELNVRRLSNLVDQLLDFRSIEKGKLLFRPKQIDLNGLMKSLVVMFENQAIQKDIAIQYESSHSDCITEFDPDFFQKIADNLISNAIKYTPEGGQIRVHWVIRVGELPDGRSEGELIVEDNGTGIDADVQKHIFEPFYRGQTGLANKGYGIGLALVKEMLESIGGSIEVKSPIFDEEKSHPGSRFIARFPFSEPIQLSSEPCERKFLVSSFEHNPERSALGKTVHETTLLLAEDNVEMREMLCTELEHSFNVIVAPDGERAFQLSKDKLPDLVIADVMMPKMDGFELVKSMKTESITAHIPIVLLTALKSDSHQRQGLEMGADDYINKPVSLEILQLKVRNLLETRKNLTSRIRQQYDLEQSSASPLDEHYNTFMEQTKRIILENLDHSDFDVESLAQEMGMSRAVFYRKFETISGEQPAGFIRSIRMKTAAKLVLEGNLNITEIALSVGFTEGGNFSRTFKQFYNCSPSKYRTQANEEIS